MALALDLLCGRVDCDHVLYRHLREHGITDDDLSPCCRGPCVPDVIGLNYYVTSERWLDERSDCHPALVGGNGRDAYADVEAVRASPDPIDGHAGALAATWERYRRPLAFTEGHLGCTREEQLRWWDEAWRAATEARAHDVNVRAVTAWALFGSHDWDSLLVEDRGHYEPGVFDARPPTPRPTALAAAVAACARGSAFEHRYSIPAAGGVGRRGSPMALHSGAPAATHSARPIFIAMDVGALAHAFEQVCVSRGLLCVVADAASVSQSDVLRAWALVTAAAGSNVIVASRATQRVRLAVRSPDLVSAAHTHVLVHAVLESLIDGEEGLWRLVDGCAERWADAPTEYAQSA